MRDPVFRAIANIRHRGWIEEFIRSANARPKHDYSDADEDTRRKKELLEATIKNIRKQLDTPPDPEDERVLAQAFLDAVKRGDMDRLNAMCGLYETKMIQRPRDRQSDVKSWHYYAGMAALHLFRQGVVPTKKQVKERTLVECARAEFAMNPVKVPIADWGKQIDDKMNQMRGLLPSERSWSRIFNDLGLSALPTAPTHPKR
jgi:hypothetical protein